MRDVLAPGGRAGGETITQAGEVRSARVESLRALAALAVMNGHIFLRARNDAGAPTLDTFPHRILLGGGYGVYLFFALTGYLLFWPFAREAFQGGTPIDLKRYARNRAVRILPLYWTVVVVLLLVQGGGGSFHQWWRFGTFSENFSVRTVGTVDGAMWSLAVEVEFYLLLPLLAWLLARATRNSRVQAAVALIGLGVASYLVRQHVFAGGGRRLLLEYSLPSTFIYFVPGMLLALLRVEWNERLPLRLSGPLASSDLWLVLAVGAALWQFDDYSNQYAIAVASFLAVGACVLPLRHGALIRVLDCRPLAALGVASYSLYLWHGPIVFWLAQRSWLPHAYLLLLPIAGCICVAVAFVSYRLIEAPFLRLRRQWSPASASTAAPERPVSVEGSVEPTAPATVSVEGSVEATGTATMP